MAPKSMTGNNHWRFVAVVCFGSYLIGFIFVTQAGLYFVNVINNHSTNLVLLVVSFFEIIAVVHVYGLDRFIEQCKDMVGPEVTATYRLTWRYLEITLRYVAPILLSILALMTLIQTFTENFGGLVCKDVDAAGCADAYWGVYLGHIIGAISLACIPAIAFRKFYYDRYLVTATSPAGGDDNTKHIEMNTSKDAPGLV